MSAFHKVFVSVFKKTWTAAWSGIGQALMFSPPTPSSATSVWQIPVGYQYVVQSPFVLDGTIILEGKLVIL